jgi:hypothetical protein
VGFWSKITGTFESWFGLGGESEVAIGKDGSGNMLFKDLVAGSGHTLTDLIAGTGGLTPESHRVLRQLIHFIDNGPAEGFATGAYREVTGPLVFPTGITWYEDVTKAKKIVERVITWTGPTMTTSEWKMYDTDGSTVIATVTDTIAYVGVFEDDRTRAIWVAP